jgi:hypothetical protein
VIFWLYFGSFLFADGTNGLPLLLFYRFLQQILDSPFTVLWHILSEYWILITVQVMTTDIDILLEIHENCNSNPHLDKDPLQSYC